MAKITFIILAHENADHVADLASLLTEWDPHANAVIHYDLNTPRAQFEKLKARVASSPRIHLVKDRLKCGWGGFSLVDAVVRALRVIRSEKIGCDRVMLVSGACMPIRPLREFSQFLDHHPAMEFIEAHDSSWMVGGLRKERYQYWHFFNHQTHPWLFNQHFQLQRKYWPKRRFPRGLEPRFGSQWWCLSWALCEKILDYIQKHPLTYFFFSTTWIPDELFFQTMAFKFTHIENLSRRTLTFFHFNEWGKPIVLVDDHAALVRGLPFFFARKVSTAARKLRAELVERARQPAPAEPLTIDFAERYRFPYEDMVAALPKRVTMTPQLFQERSPGQWADVLDTCPKSFAVLYGPPQLTRRAAEVLRSVEGLTMLGRLLRPGAVDFGSGVEDFHGLHADDNLIRDFDASNYFGRVLSRIDDLVVFELAPGDNPQGEMALLQSRNALVLPIMPERDIEVMQRLYWTLVAGDDIEAAGAETPVESFRAMEHAVEARVPAGHRAKVDAYLDAAGAKAEGSAMDWQAALRFRHGDVVMPLLDKIETMEAAVNAADIADLTADLPDDWRASVMRLGELDIRWRLPRVSFPIALPEQVTRAKAHQEPQKVLADAVRGLAN